MSTHKHIDRICVVITILGIIFAILFMNCCAPLIDRWTMPRYFGEVKKHG